MLPVRAFPGLLSRALFHPGMEKVIESLFDSRGNECVAMSVDVDGETWGNVIQQYVNKSAGTPIAYAYRGEVVTEPNFKSVITADTLYLLLGTMKA